jgi:hypothetical protein
VKRPWKSDNFIVATKTLEMESSKASASRLPHAEFMFIAIGA